MSTIAPHSGRDAAIAQPQAGAASNAGTSAQASASGPTAGSDTAAVVLDRSERAKMIVARAQADQLVTGRQQRAAISDADFAVKYHDQIAWTASAFDRYLPPEKGQALRAALANGTLKFQAASDVAGLNTQTSVSYASGSGQGMSVATSSHPTGAIKDAVDQGDAFVLWTSDRGDVYVTW